jgi:hypothetical protein
MNDGNWIMTIDEVTEAAQHALADLDQSALKLLAIDRNNEKSNVWRVKYALGFRQVNISLYLFSHSGMQQAAENIQERLVKSLKLTSE